MDQDVNDGTGDGQVADLRRRLAEAEAELERYRASESANCVVHERLLTETQDLRDAQRLSGVGSWSFDLRTQQTSWSEQLWHIYGLEPGEIELTPTTYLEVMVPEDAERMRSLAEQSAASGRPYETDFRVPLPDGRTRIASAHGEIERDAEGNPVRFLGTCQDVTALRAAQRDLVEARDLFQQLLSAATEQAVIGFDLERRVTVFNRGAERMLGWTAAELIGTEGADRFHARAELPTLQDCFERVVSGEDPDAADRRWTYVRKDGTTLRARLAVSPMRDLDGNITGHLGVATDVSDQLRAERERDGHEKMLRAIVDNDQSAIYVKDLQHRYVLVNRAFADSFGRTEAEILGNTDEDLFPEHDPAYWRGITERALTGPYRSEDVVVLPDGEHVYEAVKLPLHDADGQVYAVCGISLDVTERRRAEAEVQRAMTAMGEARDRALAANSAKNAFLATMSHEIRTPMNAVIGLTGLLLDTRLDDQQHDLAETVRRSGEHLMTIISDILDFSKVEAGELDLEARPFDLRAFTTRTVNRFSDIAGGLHLAVEVEPHCPVKVVGDEMRLRQVLGNLVDNAVKFTSEGGVLVRVDLENPDEQGRDVLRFDVRDTGIGIAEADLEGLFQPFTQVDGSTTRTYGGTGLGLAICRGIVEAMGGTLSVQSEPGAGSVFSVTVPVGSVAAETPAAPPHAFEEEREPVAASAVPVQGGSLRILLVEDNEVNQKVGTMMLAKLGHRADVAQNGELALTAARAVRYDVVLMDMHMPVMDGLEATRRIRSQVAPERQPFIVAVTASVTREDREACAAAGMNAYIPKPIQISELSAVLSEYQAARAAAGAPAART